MRFDRAEKQRRIKRGDYLMEERENSKETKGRERG